MKHVKTFESFLNESELGYSVGDTVTAIRKDGKEYKGKVEKLNPLKIRISPSEVVTLGNHLLKDVFKNTFEQFLNEGKLNPAEIKKALKEAGALMNTTYNHNRNDQDNMSDAVQDMIDAQNQGVEDPEIDAWLDKYGSNY